MSEPTSKKAKLGSNNSSDRIVLNVGGTKIYTSKVTLTSSSSYFSSQLSEEWNNNSEEENEKEFFLDQDPDDFKILLNFMRLGKIEAKKLRPFVLMQANFLGMERLLAAVRVTAKRMVFRNGDKSLFDSAVQAGIMKTNDADAKKEFASLIIYDPNKVRVLRQEKFNFELEMAVAEIRTSKEDPTNKKISFIDGLNALSRLGYTEFEEEASKSENLSEPHIRAYLQFSRMVEDEGAKELANLILNDPPSENCEEEKEYALQVEVDTSPINRLRYIEAAFGDERLLNITFREGINDEVRTIRTRTTRLEQIEHRVAMEWLHKGGYVRRESQLESWCRSSVLDIESQHYCSSLCLWSRPAVQARTGST